ncbi:MAG: hypothetical protein KAS67_02115, partial [Thermoplasmata archaeon]|nr:hypothetical protein [Thermoplasmata archaeon]
ANLNIEAIVLDSPREEYVCLGLHQKPDEELDLDYCRENNIGFFRREIGGGTVWLDNRQVFYNIILRRDNPMVPRLTQNFFSKFLGPVVDSCKSLGLDAAFNPICDLLVNGKKISGNGGGEIGGCKVIAGGLLIDFDFDEMSKILNLSQPLRTHFRKSMDENLTTMKMELGHAPPKEEVFDHLAANFESFLGPLEGSTITQEIRKEMDRLRGHYFSNDWLFQRGAKNLGREIKVREGNHILGTTAEQGGRSHEIIIFSSDGKVSDIQVAGSHDIPPDLMTALSGALMGMDYDQRKIINGIKDIV